ncbi:hypothetical protein [Streptomyces zaomyceticus]|uniref:hypothetical protein n=1 Tax=Streptomyces zaomyceticus TaxID=68286 RepID=UPI00343A796E
MTGPLRPLPRRAVQGRKQTWAPLTAAAVAATLLCGCGAPAARVDGARQAGVAFEQALADADYGRACALMAPQTREELEDNEGKPCGPALEGQDLSAAGGEPDTQVYGRQALLRLPDDTLFLSQFADGWKVTAAGCAPQTSEPYRCSVKGG